MELLRPTRIKSLEAEIIRVIVHGSQVTKTTSFTLPAVFPFETLYSLKQRIALHFAAGADAKAWLPGYVFVAQKVGTTYKSLEFYWPFGKMLADPLEAVGTVDARLWDGESRKPVFPHILSGATIEATTTLAAVGGAGDGDGKEREIHIWSLQHLAAAAGFDVSTPITESIFHGFLSLYFPLVESRDDLIGLFGPLTKDETDVLENAKQYRESMDARLAKVEAALDLPAVVNAGTPRLRELRLLRFRLPQVRAIDEGQLEMKFYEMNPSRTLPFMRFFSRNEKTAPLVKLAVTETGAQVIDNPKLLDLLMADEPAAENGAILLLKAPVKHTQAPFGTTWSMRIYENGTAHLMIGAPRKNEPLTTAAIQAAFDALPAFLAETPWPHPDTPRELEEISAVYDFRSPIAEKPSKSELRGRLDAFLPFLMEER